MKLKEIFNKRFYWFLVITSFVGILPIILYPFSGYFGKQNDFSKGNHGPLHQYPDGDYYDAIPRGVDWLIDKTCLFPILIMLLLSVIISIYLLFAKKYKVGFAYLITAGLSFVLLIFQFLVLWWLFD